MWRARRPAASATEAAEACADGTGDPDLADRLRAACSQLEVNSRKIRASARRNRLHTAKKSGFPVSTVSDGEFKQLYKYQLGKRGRPASRIRNEILGSAENGLCCYCHHGQATTLDHVVPKGLVPTLAIDPWNLVPSCSRCNHLLQSQFSVNAHEQLFHPLLMPDLGRWLWATVNAGLPTTVSFQAKPDARLTSELRRRIRHEFTSLELGFLFAVCSGPDLTEVGFTLGRNFGPGQRQLVRDHLDEIASDAFEVDVNSRRGALLEALASNDAYCDGGFLGV